MFRRGHTLLEVAVAILVVLIFGAPFALYLGSLAKTDGHLTDHVVATRLAQALLEELLSKNFEDPNLASGSFGTEEGARSSYDDADDYDNFGPESPPVDIDGRTMTEHATFSRSASVVNLINVGAGTIPRTNFTAQTDGSTGFKRITVTVTWDLGSRSVVLEAVISRH